MLNNNFENKLADLQNEITQKIKARDQKDEDFKTQLESNLENMKNNLKKMKKDNEDFQAEMKYNMTTFRDPFGEVFTSFQARQDEIMININQSIAQSSVNLHEKFRIMDEEFEARRKKSKEEFEARRKKSNQEFATKMKKINEESAIKFKLIFAKIKENMASKHQPIEKKTDISIQKFETTLVTENSQKVKNFPLIENSISSVDTGIQAPIKVPFEDSISSVVHDIPAPKVKTSSFDKKHTSSIPAVDDMIKLIKNQVYSNGNELKEFHIKPTFISTIKNDAPIKDPDKTNDYNDQSNHHLDNHQDKVTPDYEFPLYDVSVVAANSEVLSNVPVHHYKLNEPAPKFLSMPLRLTPFSSSFQILN